MKRFWIACLGSWLVAAGVAHAEFIEASAPEKVLAVASRFGPAKLSTDSKGDPQIEGLIKGDRYWVFFYGCRDNAQCTEIQLTTYLPAKKLPLERVNEWNSRKKMGRVYIASDGDLTFDIVCNLDGGVSEKNLLDNFAWFQVVWRELRTF